MNPTIPATDWAQYATLTTTHFTTEEWSSPLTDTLIELGSIAVAGCGVLTNSLSLSYFLSTENSSLPTRLLLLLNSLDLVQLNHFLL